ncbi:Cof-type HAD-IIB family hydrolase [Ligilactobacillus ceti]|uniref:HAD superfamily hydrolase n=1 Tax=Ligilactobacillus ceti DSM 22408 TaxID=1122146 RepID=A0A0R2KKA0_9LACO|nr:Cof-type HAD-IIB family hydrolase [Ligilactobacillus ceti]KRN89809.1 HAD superfamily hydrolase [Ligilactobacillus ceti DSM 22408]
MAYKMVVCDLDETLIDSNAQIPVVNQEAIKKATEQGIYFVPNTGRNPGSVQNILKELDLYQKENQYVISFNGAAVLENKDVRPVIVKAFPHELVDTLFNLGKERYPDGDIHIYTMDQLYVYQINDGDREYMDPRIPDWKDLPGDNLDFLREVPIFKILFNIYDEAERIAFKKYLEEHSPAPLNITFSSDRYVECNLANCDKGTAALALGERLGIKPEEIIAIGDNGNDIGMIEKVGLGVCVKNGRDFVKEVSDYVTEKTNAQGAVAEVIDKFIFQAK